MEDKGLTSSGCQLDCAKHIGLKDKTLDIFFKVNSLVELCGSVSSVCRVSRLISLTSGRVAGEPSKSRELGR